MFGDTITASERLNPKSRLVDWLEEQVIRNRIAIAQRQLESFEFTQRHLMDSIPRQRAVLQELLDWQKGRGFPQGSTNWSQVFNWLAYLGCIGFLVLSIYFGTR